MMDENAFNELIQEIKAQGIDEPTAARYAGLIGDTPVTDKNGNLLVMDFQTNKILATLKMPKMFQRYDGQ